MKKKIWILGIIVFVILLIVPLSVKAYEDGGTRVYRAATYTLVDWNRTDECETYSKLSLYLPPRAYKSVDDLWDIEMGNCYEEEEDIVETLKPVLYLYPETETLVDVELSLKGELTCTYPAYEDGWTVTAQPDGTLTDGKGQSYNYLYWEGEVRGNMDYSKGFCVAGKDTASFLEWALAELGLTRREANEFIVYWLPQMEDNAYNLIYFQGKSYTDTTELKISPQPDSLIRIYMTWKASEQWVDLPAQELIAPERKGFVAVEWGGVELTEE